MLIGPKRIYRSPPAALVALAEQKRSSALAATAEAAAAGANAKGKEAKEKAAAQARGRWGFACSTLRCFLHRTAGVSKK